MRVAFVMVLLMTAHAWGKPMRKQDAKQPVFVSGPTLEPAAERDRWLGAHAADVVRLPFTIWRDPHLGPEAAVGFVAEKPRGATFKLNDGALGIPLSERLQQLCGDAPRCVVRLSGRFQDKTFAIFRVWDKVEPGAPVRLEVERPKSCLAIRALKPTHCARGATRCTRCKDAEAKPAVPRLLDVCPEGDLARPTITIGDKVRVFDVLESFADVAEATAFAERHGITDVAF
jgi:hypothetical protein